MPQSPRRCRIGDLDSTGSRPIVYMRASGETYMLADICQHMKAKKDRNGEWIGLPETTECFDKKEPVLLIVY